MKTKHYKTLEGLLRASRNYCDLYELIFGRKNINYKWYNFTLPEDVLDSAFSEFAHVIWARPTQAQINALQNCKKNYWWMDRFTVHLRKEGRKNVLYYSYCAGQDYDAEMRTIRKNIQS